MKLKVLGSGSSGNCYLLENDTECLVIEAGVSFMEVKKAIDFNVKKIVGVISSHIHQDHNKYLEQYKKAGISAWCFGAELQEYDADKMKHYVLGMGNFRIIPFPLVHDVPCYGFYIKHSDIGSLVYASDTEYITQRFTKAGVNHILVEANYSMDYVDKDKPNFEHVIQGHMSIDTTCEFLATNNNPQLRNVILCHLSNSNAVGEDFRTRAEKVVDCDVYVAHKGLEINLDEVPF